MIKAKLLVQICLYRPFDEAFGCPMRKHTKKKNFREKFRVT